MDYVKYFNFNGILLLDKPKGITSNCALQQVKRIFFAKKVGYTGSLDPLATGMLPILFGNATKFSRYLTNSIKKYHVIVKLGETTVTGDLSGEILKKRSVCLNIHNVKKILKTFVGEIKQTPPMFSALKYKGIPLYKYARLGISVPRKNRNLIIYQLNFIQLIDNFLEFTIVCSKGTYIRSLVDDVGKKLKCGAHVIYLCRLQVGLYVSSQLINLTKLYFIENQNINQTHRFYLFNMLSTFLLPISSFFLEYPIVKLTSQDADNFKKKLCIYLVNCFKIGLVQVTTGKKNIFLGIGRLSALGLLTPECILLS
ncbi:tRNA pseudouridine(55) synthase TruB [Buchnera aphidicola]|uniref:tRNA pseudouridine synthase B n=1 Tax=Buchnera aphidicola (Cinara strobi) TaxID=1921549 RepID=A0A3B1DLP2_9GAMM|nr:tRNA pseudouridine(55) synthase TruB [Buchnera aphidicola]VAX76621.1 tRNA pseudouridine synthase B [Buchnera aphidicola (Cinara strobi)]